jgi:hypothetical protein
VTSTPCPPQISLEGSHLAGRCDAAPLCRARTFADTEVTAGLHRRGLALPRGGGRPRLARVLAVHRLNALYLLEQARRDRPSIVSTQALAILIGTWGGAMLMLQPSLTHFVTSLSGARARWSTGDELGRLLDDVSGDIVQAIQALKESKAETTPALLGELQRLLTSLELVSSYCSSAHPQALAYPFTRAQRQVQDGISFLYPEAAGARPSPEAAKIMGISATKRAVGIETFQLGPHRMPRVFNGFWQLSSPAWGSASTESQEAALAELVELGLGTSGEWALTLCLWF